MFLKMRKSDKSKSEQSDDVLEAGQNNEDTDREEDILVDRVTNLEEKVNRKTRKPENAGQPPGGLSETKDSEEEDDIAARAKAVPAQILEVDTEPVVEPAEAPPGGEQNLNIILGNADTEKAEPKSEDEPNMLSDIFSDADEEVDPLAGLIDLLPDVTAGELLQEVQAITTMMHEQAAK